MKREESKDELSEGVEDIGGGELFETVGVGGKKIW